MVYNPAGYLLQKVRDIWALKKLEKKRPEVSKCRDLLKDYSPLGVKKIMGVLPAEVDACKFLEGIPEGYRNRDVILYISKMVNFVSYIGDEELKRRLLMAVPELLKIGGLHAFESFLGDLYKLSQATSREKLWVYAQHFSDFYRYGEYLDLARLLAVSDTSEKSSSASFDTLSEEDKKLMELVRSEVGTPKVEELEKLYRVLLKIAESKKVEPLAAIQLIVKASGGKSSGSFELPPQLLELSAQDIPPEMFVEYLKALAAVAPAIPSAAYVDSSLILCYGLKEYIDFLTKVRNYYLEEKKDVPDALKELPEVFETWVITYLREGIEGFRSFPAFVQEVDGSAYLLGSNARFFWKELDQTVKTREDFNFSEFLNYLLPFLNTFKDYAQLWASPEAERIQRLLVKIPADSVQLSYNDYLEILDFLQKNEISRVFFPTAVEFLLPLLKREKGEGVEGFKQKFALLKQTHDLLVESGYAGYSKEGLGNIISNLAVEDGKVFYAHFEEVLKKLTSFAEDSLSSKEDPLNGLLGFVSRVVSENDFERGKIQDLMKELLNILDLYARKMDLTFYKDRFSSIKYKKKIPVAYFIDISPITSGVLYDVYKNKKFGGIGALKEFRKLLEYFVDVTEKELKSLEKHWRVYSPEGYKELLQDRLSYRLWVNLSKASELYRRYDIKTVRRLAKEIYERKITPEIFYLIEQLPEDYSTKIIEDILEIFEDTDRYHKEFVESAVTHAKNLFVDNYERIAQTFSENVFFEIVKLVKYANKIRKSKVEKIATALKTPDILGSINYFVERLLKKTSDKKMAEKYISFLITIFSKSLDGSNANEVPQFIAAGLMEGSNNERIGTYFLTLFDIFSKFEYMTLPEEIKRKYLKIVLEDLPYTHWVQRGGEEKTTLKKAKEWFSYLDNVLVLSSNPEELNKLLDTIDTALFGIVSGDIGWSSTYISLTDFLLRPLQKLKHLKEPQDLQEFLEKYRTYLKFFAKPENAKEASRLFVYIEDLKENEKKYRNYAEKIEYEFWNYPWYILKDFDDAKYLFSALLEYAKDERDLKGIYNYIRNLKQMVLKIYGAEPELVDPALKVVYYACKFCTSDVGIPKKFTGIAKKNPMELRALLMQATILAESAGKKAFCKYLRENKII